MHGRSFKISSRQAVVGQHSLQGGDLRRDIHRYIREQRIIQGVVGPSKGQASKQLQLDEYIASKGYDYLNMNNVLDELNLDYSTDFYNSKHVNIAGAKKVTTYLAQYIEDNYGLQSKLTDVYTLFHPQACLI